jgi:hypothetical protein
MTRGRRKTYASECAKSFLYTPLSRSGRRLWQTIKWVNNQRCSINISNTPDGTWIVRVGTLPNHKHRSLFVALHSAMKQMSFW